MKYDLIFVLLLSFSLWHSSVYAEQVYVERERYHPFFVHRMTSLNDKTVSKLKEQTYMASVSERKISKAIEKGYFAFVLAKLQESKLPYQLALIPLIESNYESKAISGKGAGGMWQLMPATSTQLGITNADRFELKASTIAALHHFKTLYQELGDWELTIAAYNAGSHRVKKATSKTPGASIQHLDLPLETKAYVMQFRTLQRMVSEKML